MKRLVILSAMVFALLFCQTADAELVINGDFQHNIPGWTNTAYGVSWGDGNFAAGFSYFPGVLSQTIPTVPDASYTFSFLVVHDSPGGTQNIAPYYPATQYLQASWDGNVIFNAPTWNFAAGNHYPSSPSIDYGWERYEFVVTATGASTIIEFSGQDTGGFYFLDNVSVSQVATPTPVPATLLLLASGLAGLAGFRRRLKNE
jgi:hypothetical protein